MLSFSLWNVDPDKGYTHWPECKLFEMELLVALNIHPDSDPSGLFMSSFKFTQSKFSFSRSKAQGRNIRYE